MLDDPHRDAGSARGGRQRVALHVDELRARRQAGAVGFVVDERIPGGERGVAGVAHRQGRAVGLAGQRAQGVTVQVVLDDRADEVGSGQAGAQGSGGAKVDDGGRQRTVSERRGECGRCVDFAHPRQQDGQGCVEVLRLFLDRQHEQGTAGGDRSGELHETEGIVAANKLNEEISPFHSAGSLRWT